MSRLSCFTPGTSQVNTTSVSFARTSTAGLNVRLLVAVPNADPMTSSNMRSSVETAFHVVSMKHLLVGSAETLGSGRELDLTLFAKHRVLARQGHGAALNPGLAPAHPSAGGRRDVVEPNCS